MTAPMTLTEIRAEINMAEKDPGHRFVVHNVSKAFEPRQPIVYVVENLIRESTLNFFVGDSGSKKTLAAYDLGFCVALGEKWLKKFQVTKGKVLIINEDMSDLEVLERLEKHARGHFQNQTDLIDLDFMTCQRVDFTNPDYINDLQNYIHEQRYSLVIVDTLLDIMPGKSDNDSKDMEPILQSFRSIANLTGCAFLILHHWNKQGTVRGSTVIKAKADLMVDVESKQDSRFINFKLSKGRAVSCPPFAAEISFSENTIYLAEAEEIESSKKALSKGHRHVLRYLLAHGKSLKKDIIFEPDICTEGTAKNAFGSLVEWGFIKRVDGGNQGAKAIYDLTTEGRAIAEKL
jgi:DNA-binding MarR family transcriptional regulator